MSKHRNRKTVCRECRHRGPQVRVNGTDHATCLRHRMDGRAQALPADWLEDLETKEARCDLYQLRGAQSRRGAPVGGRV